jgi:hypothetical protein
MFGKENNVLLNKAFNLLDIVEFKTILPNERDQLEEVSVLKVPVFFLYYLVKDKDAQKTFQMVMDILSAVTIITGVGTIISASASTLAKLVAIGLITKEVSSLLIQNRHIDSYLSTYDPEFLVTWKAIDTAGDIATVLISLPEITNFIKRGKDLKRGMAAQGITISSKLEDILEKAKKLASAEWDELKDVVKAPQFAMADGSRGINVPLDTRLLMIGNQLSERVDNLLKLSKGGTPTEGIKKYYKNTLQELKQYALKNKKDIGNELLAIQRAIDQGQNVYANIFKLERLRLTHLKTSTLTKNQLNFLEELEKLKNITDKEFKKLASYILEAPTGGQLPKQALQKIRAGKIYDVNIRDWRYPMSATKIKMDRLDKAIEILEKKRYYFLAQLARDTKNYRTTHDKGIREFLQKAKDKEFNEYLDIFRVDGNPNNAFMPLYQDFGEGMLSLRQTIKDGEKITAKELTEVMKGYERHHQIMVNIMKDNPTFQKVMDWALSRKPPLTIGFNEFRKNIIILAKEQHGFHNLRTKKMHEIVDKIDEIFKKHSKELNIKIGELEQIINVGNEKQYLKAFNQLKKIIKIETELIIKKVIQVQNTKLDDL